MDANKSIVAFDLLKELKDMLRTQSYLFLEIGRILKRFRDDKLYRDLGQGGYDTWTEFLGSGELSQKPSTVQAYIQVYETMILRLKYRMEEIAEIPYDKLRLALPEINKAKTKEEAEEWLGKARELSRSDILRERGLMTESGKPIGWSKTVHAVTCEYCGGWKLSEPLELCDCKGGS